MKKILSLFLSLVMVASLTTGCARNIGSTEYTEAQAGEAARTYRGTIISTRGVVVNTSDKGSENPLGLIVGGITGGVLGNTVGGGSGKRIATVGGALAGAAAGTYAQQELGRQNAIEYVVELENGETLSMIQGPEPFLAVGQKVFLIEGVNGRGRLIAR